MTCQTNLATNIKDNKTAEDEKICSGSPNDFGQPIKTWGGNVLKTVLNEVQGQETNI